MSVLDQFSNAETEERQDNYQFAAGDLNFIDEMAQPKQHMELPEMPEMDEENENNTDSTEQEPQNDELIAAAVEETATIITETIDNGAAFGLSILSKNPIEVHKATDEQKERLRKIIYVYCEKTGGYIPLWLQLVILILGIYGTQIPAALEQRKINILEEKVREQEKRLRAYELEERNAELREELAAKKAEKEKE